MWHNQKRVVLGTVLIAACVVSLVFLRHFFAPTDLVYQGHGIDYWFAEIATSPTSDWAKAFQSFDTNAVPYLLEKLKTEEDVRDKINVEAYSHNLNRAPFRSAALNRRRAAMAMIELGRLPTGAIQELQSLSTNQHYEISKLANRILILTQNKTNNQATSGIDP